MPKYMLEGTVTFGWTAVIETADEQEARMTVECEVLDGKHLDLDANDLGKTKITEVINA